VFYSSNYAAIYRVIYDAGGQNIHRMRKTKKLSCCRGSATFRVCKYFAKSLEVKVIENSTIRKLWYGVLFAFDSNCGCIFGRFDTIRERDGQTTHNDIGRTHACIARQKCLTYLWSFKNKISGMDEGRGRRLYSCNSPEYCQNCSEFLRFKLPQKAQHPNFNISGGESGLFQWCALNFY